MSPRPKGSGAPMTEEHKAALAAGRAQGKAVRDYLEALEGSKPKRGRPRTVDVVRQQLELIPKMLENADPVMRLQLVQRRIDLEAELERLSGPRVDVQALEDEFVKVAGAYSKSKGITYAAWREIGVDASVLKRAGIGRAS